MRKRIEWIDICKGILIITIVLMHIDADFWVNNKFGIYINNLSSLYKVAIFFCVSGLTIKDEEISNTKKFIIKKIKTLWSKIIVFGSIAVVCHNALIKIGFYDINTNYAGKRMFFYDTNHIIKELIFTVVMANREIIIGPLWYANVLFMALMILAIVDKFAHVITKNNNDSRYVRFIITLILMLSSSFLTNILDFTIPRFNNSLSAVFLIDLCQLIYHKYHIQFNNWRVFTIFLIVLLNLPFYGKLSLNNNYYLNPTYLIAVSITSMYILFFISKRVRGGLAKMLSFFGRQSFYIMALHFFAFKIGTKFLLMFEIKGNVATITPYASNLPMMVFYLLIGLFIPSFIGVFIYRIGRFLNEKA